MLAAGIILALMILSIIALLTIYAILIDKKQLSNTNTSEDSKFINALMDKAAEENLKRYIEDLDKALENPEYISKEEKEKQAKNSEEYFSYLKAQQKQSSNLSSTSLISKKK